MSRTRTTLFAALPLLVVALAGCTAADDATETKTDSQIAAEAQAWDVENASCLRDAGIDVGDPSGDDPGVAVALGDDVDVDDLSAATEKCQESTTDKLGERPVTAAEKKSQEKFEAELLESNACLRDKGYDAPDPTDAGGGGVSISADGLADVPEDVLEECGAFGGRATLDTP